MNRRAPVCQRRVPPALLLGPITPRAPVTGGGGSAYSSWWMGIPASPALWFPPAGPVVLVGFCTQRCRWLFVGSIPHRHSFPVHLSCRGLSRDQDLQTCPQYCPAACRTLEHHCTTASLSNWDARARDGGRKRYERSYTSVRSVRRTHHHPVAQSRSPSGVVASEAASWSASMPWVRNGGQQGRPPQPRPSSCAGGGGWQSVAEGRRRPEKRSGSSDARVSRPATRHTGPVLKRGHHGDRSWWC
jgi:hypothetical protein